MAEVRPAVDRRLAAIWSREQRGAKRHGKDVAAMVDAARDLTLRGGKRFRAALLVAAYVGVAPRAPRDVALDAGAALELLQTYLLTQDDWMDGDDLRRGGPSAHAALSRVHGDGHLGAASAILASDLTWGLAVGVLAACDAPLPRRLLALDLLLRVHRDVVIGQQLDLLGNTEDVEAMHALKTGSYTVRGPLSIGAALAGATDETRRALERFAAPLGVAFQLRDDLLGTFGKTERTGKPVGNDLCAGKRTAILAEADERLDRAQRRLVDAVLGNKSATASDIRAATLALEACGAREAVESRLASLLSDAEHRAASLPLSPASRELLAGAAHALRGGV